MIKRLLIFLVLLFSFVFCEQKYFQLSTGQMLSLVEEDIDLALVKLSIDKEIDPSVDIDYYMNRIDEMVSGINVLLPENPTSRDKLETLKKYLYESGAWNNYQPFAYDLDDPLGHRLKNNLLSNYIDDRRGNCVSMPNLFLILGRKIGLKVFLAKAPEHEFIQYVDDSGITLNIETTNGGSINRDVFYIEEHDITEKAIENKIFLVPLTNKETVLSMYTLLNIYYIEIEDFDKALAVCNIVLRYTPKDVYALARKGATYSHILDKELATRGYTEENIKDKITKEDKQYLNNIFKQHKYWFARAEALGWKTMTIQEGKQKEKEYLKTIEEEKEYQRQKQSGLYSMRYPDIRTAQFMGRDRVKLEDDQSNYFGVNPYLFNNNNPIRYVDPDGNKLEEITIYTDSNKTVELQKIFVEAQVADTLTDFIQEAVNDSIITNVNNTFRTFIGQASARKQNSAAATGFSHHNAGLAVDFNFSRDNLEDIRKLADKHGINYWTTEEQEKIFQDKHQEDMHFWLDYSDAGYKSLDSAVKENMFDYKKLTGSPVGEPPARWYKTDESGATIIK